MVTNLVCSDAMGWFNFVNASIDFVCPWYVVRYFFMKIEWQILQVLYALCMFACLKMAACVHEPKMPKCMFECVLGRTLLWCRQIFVQDVATGIMNFSK